MKLKKDDVVIRIKNPINLYLKKLEIGKEYTVKEVISNKNGNAIAIYIIGNNGISFLPDYFIKKSQQLEFIF